MKRKMHFGENWLIFLGIWGEDELILRIWGAKEKYFQGAEEFWEISALFFRDQGSIDLLGASILYSLYALTCFADDTFARPSQSGGGKCSHVPLK